MRALASLFCGFVFGWGLFISGMIRPDKVLGFLDILAIPSGKWDPSLAVVMAAALVVTGVGYALLRAGARRFSKRQNQWPTQTAIDRPLVAGSILFGIGWGLVGLARDRRSRTWRRCRRRSSCFVVAMAARHVWCTISGMRAAPDPFARASKRRRRQQTRKVEAGFPKRSCHVRAPI